MNISSLVDGCIDNCMIHNEKLSGFYFEYRVMYDADVIDICSSHNGKVVYVDTSESDGIISGAWIALDIGNDLYLLFNIDGPGIVRLNDVVKINDTIYAGDPLAEVLCNTDYDYDWDVLGESITIEIHLCHLQNNALTPVRFNKYFDKDFVIDICRFYEYDFTCITHEEEFYQKAKASLFEYYVNKYYNPDRTMKLGIVEDINREYSDMINDLIFKIRSYGLLYDYWIRDEEADDIEVKAIGGCRVVALTSSLVWYDSDMVNIIVVESNSPLPMNIPVTDNNKDAVNASIRSYVMYCGDFDTCCRVGDELDAGDVIGEMYNDELDFGVIPKCISIEFLVDADDEFIISPFTTTGDIDDIHRLTGFTYCVSSDDEVVNVRDGRRYSDVLRSNR